MHGRIIKELPNEAASRDSSWKKKAPNGRALVIGFNGDIGRSIGNSAMYDGYDLHGIDMSSGNYDGASK